MVFESGKSNLRDIHKFMTEVNRLRFGSGHSAVESKNSERCLLVESGLGEVRNEIDAYRDNLLLSRQFLSDFQLLKDKYLKNA